MSRFFKVVALFALISCGVWVAVLWHWQATARDISTRDMVTYLVLLPVTLFVFALMLRWAWIGVAEKQTRRESADTAAGAVTTSSAPAAEDAARHATVQLIAAHLVCAAGDSASDLQSAAKDGEPRPALDAELRDEDGLPILAARIGDVDTLAHEPLIETLLPVVQAKRPEWAAVLPGEHVVRALAALEGTLSAAVDSLLPWSGRFESDPNAVKVAAEGVPERRVRVFLGWPPEWSAFEQELARACAVEWLTTSGGTVFPAGCFAITMHAGGGEDLLLQADRLLQTLAREGRAEPVIVAACHSSIGASAIESMERSGVLYGPKRPKGQMPGEGAAALVLAGADWPAAPDADGPLPHLHRPTLLRRDKSVDAVGRIDGVVVGEAITQALRTARIDADALGGLVCDADLHTARAAEFYGVSVGLLPTLDSTEDMRLLANATGMVGIVSPLLVIACAAERAVALQKPQLALTLSDAFSRLALVVLPTAPPVPEGDDHPPAKAATKASSA